MQLTMDGSNKIESGTVFSAMNVNRVRIREQRDRERNIFKRFKSFSTKMLLNSRNLFCQQDSINWLF